MQNIVEAKDSTKSMKVHRSPDFFYFLLTFFL